MMTGYMHAGHLWIGTGCFIGDVETFSSKVKKTHGNNRHAKDYRHAVAYLRAKFGVSK
jgi:hypothetical protein